MTADRREVRSRFLSTRSYSLDTFQIEALDAIDAGNSVLVAAPTGSGKTLIAEYAIAIALAEGKKAFYTTPLKALSNQKYHDLTRSHGAEHVGLLTGDNAVNGDAAIVVMTTEVLRNMIYARSTALNRLGFVILDEVHYLQNAYRGPVWEEVIIHTPPEVDLVCLSATVSNAEELTSWIETVRGATVAIIEERRPVTLNHHYVVAARGGAALTMLPTFAPNGRPNPRGADYDAKNPGNSSRPFRRPTNSTKGPYLTPARTDIVEYLQSQAMLPAIYFIFSRNACSDAVRQCLNEGVCLTTPDDRERIRGIAEARVESLSDDDLRVLDYGFWLNALEAGLAAHHAGMVPPFKEVVEACFADGLVKVVFATETLALGINMPARTVVIEKLSKFTGERHEFLTPGEYTQLTGRAGRRGIDEVGHAVVLWSPFVAFDYVAGLASTRSFALSSSFRPTYNMAVNLVRRYPADVAHHLLNLSFAQYQADADVVRMETELGRVTQRLRMAEERAQCDRGDIGAYASEHDQAGTGKPRDDPAHVSKAIGHLKIGDVISDPGRPGQRTLVIISTSQRKGHDLRIAVLNQQGRRFVLTVRDFASAPHRLEHLDLPKPYNPSNRNFIRRTIAAFHETLETDDRNTLDENGDMAPRGPGGCPDLSRHLKAFGEANRLSTERDRLKTQVRGRAESLARQFDRVLGLLRELDYVDGWTLTERGEDLSSVYHEADLLVVECLRGHMLDNLDAPAVAALVSTFTYETRGPGGTGPTPFFHTKAVHRAWKQIEETWEQLTAKEQLAGLPMTKAPDPGFCGLAYAWVAGKDLIDILSDEELSGGDFVRNVKQLIDLLRQIGEIAPNPYTSRAARKAADELFRGIVAASSVVTTNP